MMFWAMNARVHFYPDSSAWIYIVLVVFINGIFIPLVLFYMMKLLGVIGSLSMDNQQERTYPFLVTGIFYITTWFVFHNLDVLDLVAYLFVLSAVLVFLALIINLFWKISVHSIAMGAMSVFILYMTAVQFISESWPAYLVIILSGLVGFSRLKLKSHTAAQVYTGYLGGAAITYLFLILM
jgi:membrane-associated phospholipid phosphatase